MATLNNGRQTRMIRREDMAAADWHAALRDVRRRVAVLSESITPSVVSRGKYQAAILSDLERSAKQHARERIRAAGGDL